jgi:hypothetical protein
LDTLIKALIACVIGLVVGLWATALSLRNARGFDAATIGAWTVSEKAGTLEADPYTRAALEQSGEIPLALGEGLQFIARTDDTGAALSPSCAYLVGRTTPPARYWTLSLVDRLGFPVANAAARYGFRSSEMAASSSPFRQARIRAIGCRSDRKAALPWCFACMIRLSAQRRRRSTRMRCRVS